MTLKSGQPNERLPRALLLSALFVALILSLYYTLPRLTSTDFGHDEGYYMEMAERLVNKGVYAYASEIPNAFVPPGFPLYLSLCYVLFGFAPDGLAVMRILQIIYTVLTVYLVYCFGSGFTDNTKLGILASWMTALNLGYYSYTFAFLTENLYFLFMMLFAVCFLKTQRQEKYMPHFLCGILFCACIMIRSAIFAILFFVYIPSFIQNGFKYTVKRALLFLLGFVILALPWWIRNAVTLGELVLFCSQPHIVFEGLAKDIYALGYSFTDTVSGTIAIVADMIKKNPGETLYWLTLGKFKVTFLTCENTGINSIITFICTAFVAITGFVECVINLFNKKYRWSSIIFLVYFIVVLLGVPNQRYGLQFLFFLSILSAQLLLSIREKVFKKYDY